jgi:hypothetical protein
MKADEIVKRAKALKAKRVKVRGDIRYLKVMGFLKAKGLLFDETIKPRPIVKLDVKDVLWVGKNVEPRVLEVFPAAYLHFTRTFLNTDEIPDELWQIIEAIRLRRDLDVDYEGIHFNKMRRWAEVPLKDLRVKPVNQKKIPKNFRLSPAAVARLEIRAKKSNLTETKLLEQLILNDL